MINKGLYKKITSLVLSLVMSITIISSVAPIPVSAGVGQPTLRIPTLDEVDCASYCVYDKTDDEIIMSKAPEQIIYPASMTKLMTCQLALDYLDPDTYLTTSQNAIDNISFDSTKMGLSVGERTTVNELLYGLMLPSGNDAANVLAEGVVVAFIQNYPANGDEVGPDGVNASYLEEQLGVTSQEILEGYLLTAFSCLMNLRAENLGLENTHFVNAHGLHDDNHYTTAYDLARIMANASNNPDFNTVISSATHVFPATNYHPEDGWLIAKNSNNLLSDPWMAATTAEGEDTHLTAFIGGKTGTTSMAGTGMTVYCVNENGHELCISVCGIPGDQYGYQTRYVASVTAYGNLECWNRNPETVIPGTLGDYHRFNSTDSELPEYDPLIIPGDNLEDFDPFAEPEEETEETTEPEISETAIDEEGNIVTTTPTPVPTEVPKELSKEAKLKTYVKDNLLICIVIVLLVVLIVLCLVILATRSASTKKKKKRKVRAYTGDPEDFL